MYVSDTKVNVLYSQIPQPIRLKLAAQLNLDVGPVKAGLETQAREQTRFSRVAVVAGYNSDLDVGSIDYPLPYLYSQHRMIWGELYGPVVFCGATLAAAFDGGARNLTIRPLSGPVNSAARRLQ